MPGSGPLRALACGAILALVLAAGCGGSSGTASSSESGAAQTGAGSASSTNGATAGSTSASGSSLKVTTVPRYGSPSSSQPVAHGTVQIAYRNITIAPDVVRVKAGTTLRWTNFDPVAHNVTAESGPQRFASHTFGEGQTFTVTLTKPGIYHYQCTIHPTTMNGTIEVVR